eukprot:TRINITY_DN14248_c0_g1_i1.p1 TRINITY_DN14248_c0_g1~~TRINITY_DN14248_c0_g1_i1.p1  ORF type:complete len:682 (+),score=97.64 TRINITY_DN14248_c0_g1_i1:64-2109(+)
MGGASSAESETRATPSALPSSLLWVKILSVREFQTPKCLNGDNILKLCNFLRGRPHKLRLYAVITVGRGQGRSEVVDVDLHGDVQFNHTAVPFTLADIIATDASLPARTATLSSTSLASTLLDRRIPEMTIKVYRVRRICRDALVSVAVLPISTRELAGTSVDHTISLHNGCGDISLQCSFNCSLTDLRDLQCVLTSPKRHSLVKFVRALAQVLQGEDGLQILLRAVPDSLKLFDAASEQKMATTVQNMLVSLCNQVSMFEESDTDSEVLRRLAPLSRSIQDFIAELGCPKNDIFALTQEWLIETFSLCAQKAGGLNRVPPDKRMLTAFLKEGEAFPGLGHLVPIDVRGRVVAEWMASGPSARREFVPKESKLGSGMFGTVWRAVDSRNGQWYAVKKSHTAQQPTVERECEVTNHVLMNPHPFIVKLFGNFQNDFTTSLVMEFCAGGDLQDAINRCHTTGADFEVPRQAAAWLAQIFLGLEHLHLILGTLLRDLKPRNVVFSDDCAKLTDFGMGRIGLASTGAFTLQNCPPGSPAFVAPEVALQKAYDSKADLYSYGVLSWNLLSGGIKDTEGDWTPPCNKWSAFNFSSLAHNHRLIEKCVKFPSRSCCRPVPGEVESDFVLTLVSFNPDQRLDHARIRSHKFMEALKLPPEEAKRSVIEDWIRSLPLNLQHGHCQQQRAG